MLFYYDTTIGELCQGKFFQKRASESEKLGKFGIIVDKL